MKKRNELLCNYINNLYDNILSNLVSNSLLFDSKESKKSLNSNNKCLFDDMNIIIEFI